MSPEESQALDEGRRLMGEGRLLEAQPRFRKVLEGGDHPEAWQMLGYIAQQAGDYAAAAEGCGKAAALGVDHWSNWFLLGHALGQLSREQEAYGAFANANRLSPERFDPASHLLRLDFKLHGYESAGRLFARIAPAMETPALAKAWAIMAFEAGHDLQGDLAGVVTAPVMTASRWAAGRGEPVLAAGEVESIPACEPHSATEPARPYPAFASNRPYLVEVTDGRVFSKSHMILTPDGAALDEAGGHQLYGRHVSHLADSAVIGQRLGEVLLDISCFAMEEIETAAMLSGPASEAFGHWEAEYLPRLQFYEQWPGFAALPLIVDAQMPQSHFDHLALLAENPLIRLQPGHGLRVRHLIYAPPPTFFPIHVLPNDLPPYVACSASPRAYRYLRDRTQAALGRAPASRRRRVYLTRKTMGWRRIRNEAEVVDFLESRGFESVAIETLSFEAQVRLFQETEAIVAPNGSSMQNIVFAPTNVKLLILTQPDIQNLAGFYGQITALGYNPHFVWGAATEDTAYKHIDYDMPVEALAEALDRP